MNPSDVPVPVQDLKQLLRAVSEMRAAQKLEYEALPGNARLWKRAREKQSVTRLEQRVDELVADLQPAYGSTDPAPGAK